MSCLRDGLVAELGDYLHPLPEAGKRRVVLLKIKDKN